MIIKVCGMTQPANIAEVAEAGADWIGFVFYPPSPRFMSMIPSQSGLLPDRARPLCLPDGVKKAGVFVDASAQDIITRVVNFGLDIVQLHGDEPPTMLRNLRRTLEGGIRPGVKLFLCIVRRVDRMDRIVKKPRHPVAVRRAVGPYPHPLFPLFS